MSDTAKDQAFAQVADIVALVNTLNVDYDRLQELRDARAEWEADNPAAFIEPNDPRAAGRWAMACPDDADELAELIEAAGDYASADDAREAIQQHPLSVETRSAWQCVGETLESAEFRVVLCTGGPHVEIVGDLDLHAEPTSPRVIYKDWGTHGELFDFDHDAVLTYAREFFYG